MPILQTIPTQLGNNGRHYAEGYLTPKSLDTQQCASFPPERVIPVIFLPGIMGSNLRLTAERQARLRQKNNIAWRPDNKLSWAWGMQDADARTRQLQLDPATTVVDVYDPHTNPTGRRGQTADDRHDNVSVTADSPLLTDDLSTCTPPRRTARQKARERGWGEVFFSSYGQLLNHLEHRLNNVFRNGKLTPDWKDLIGVDPKQWQLDPATPQSPLTEAELRAVLERCFLPVHALGYNWLRCNGESGEALAQRITGIMDDYNQKGCRCEKVILVTHSMGGLVGRALCHPAYGNLQDKILGIVHGVMPAIGAGAAYRRMRAGFEGGGITNKVLGHTGPRVTAVLANAPGGLQLLPSDAYGNDWLRVTTRSGQTLKSLPKGGDPYKEIYARADVWWGLFREEWINPAGEEEAGLLRTKKYLNKAQEFHQAINATYHPLSYAHYGCDRKHPAFQNVVWQVPDHCPADRIDTLKIVLDSTQGRLELSVRADEPERKSPFQPPPFPHAADPRAPVQLPLTATLLSAAEPGDQTVPMHSADHQLRSGKFKGVFRQTGYEHQASYEDDTAIACTLYSIVRIAQEMKWTTP